MKATQGSEVPTAVVGGESPISAGPPSSFWDRLKGRGGEAPPVKLLPLGEILFAFIFTSLPITVLSLVDIYLLGHLADNEAALVCPPFAATAALSYILPDSASAQPRSFVLGHFVGAGLGILFGNIAQFHSEAGVTIAAALAGAIYVLFGLLTGTLHPPSASMAFYAAVSTRDPFYSRYYGLFFLVTPVGLGLVLVFLTVWIMNNLVPSRSPWPRYW
jgi:CBS-domain-containing membrane protein